MRRRRGVALLIVLATVAVMTTVVMEFVHDSQVRSRIAANNQLQTETGENGKEEAEGRKRC